jgi:hypothetical protein
MAAGMKMAVFLVIVPGSMVEVCRRFRGACASIIRAMSKSRDLLIALMMEAARTSETSVNFYRTTWHNNSHFHLNLGLKINVSGSFTFH